MIKCPSCGAINIDANKTCMTCKKLLPQPASSRGDPAQGALQTGRRPGDSGKILKDMQSSDSYVRFSRSLQDKCSPVPLDQTERMMEQIEKLMARSTDPSESVESFLMHVGTLLYRSFGFAEIAIALKDEKEGDFRYQLFFGMRKEAENAYRQISYTTDDLVSPTKYPRIRLSERIDFFPGEFRPYTEGELETFNRPSQMEVDRASADDLREGDYLCLYLRGNNNEVLGWIELARTRDNKIPQRFTFRWLDLLAAVVGRIIHERKISSRGFLRQVQR